MRYTGAFDKWLCDELLASQYILLALYERADYLQYHEQPRLEQQYIDLFGELEDQVIQEELRLELLILKKQKIQTALNRREPIDEATIDAEIEARRNEMEAEAQGTGTPPEYRELTEEDQEELQYLYRKMVQNYHPATHLELTDVHRELFKKVQDAYRRKDLAAMRMTCDLMLKADNAKDPREIEEMLRLLLKHSPKKESKDEDTLEVQIPADYTLAKKLFPYVQPTGEEIALQEEWNRYRDSIREAESFIHSMEEEFPFTAEKMMSDPEAAAAYRNELMGRLSDAKRKCQLLETEIQSMIVKAVLHE